MSSQIIDLKTGSSVSAPSLTGALLPQSGEFELQVRERVGDAVQEQLEDLKIIYGEPSDLLNQAITVISEAVRACTVAISATEVGDRIQADSFMLQVQTFLPELFKLRKIGDGFGIICSALIFSFANKAGSPFTKSEMHVILRALQKLWSTPYISVENAIQVTEFLEQSGLIVDPVPLTDLFTYAEEDGLFDG